MRRASVCCHFFSWECPRYWEASREWWESVCSVSSGRGCWPLLALLVCRGEPTERAHQVIDVDGLHEVSRESRSMTPAPILRLIVPAERDEHRRHVAKVSS